MIAASRTDDFQHLSPSPAGENLHARRLKALLMDDNRFDRKRIGRLASQSKHDIEVIETTTISESRAVLEAHNLDVVFLDYRVPDGDGVTFLRELSTSTTRTAPPIVIITGEGDEAAAIRSLRSGAVDYLQKETLSVAEFDGAIAAAIMSGERALQKLESQFEAVSQELATLRRKTSQSMNLARTYLLPMAQHAWDSIKAEPETERNADASRLARITRSLSGFLDETLVHSSADCLDATPELVNLHELLQHIVSSSERISDSTSLAPPVAFPQIMARQDYLVMLFREICADIVTNMREEVELAVRIDCVQDPSGNPIVRISDNGLSLRARQQALAEQSIDIARSGTHPICQGMKLSLCQRLAEMNGGELKVVDGAGGGCVTMIRFPAAVVARC